MRPGALAIVATLTLSLDASTANAQSTTNAEAVYDGWLKAFLVTSGGQTYFANSLTDRSMAFMWGQAYLITGVEDAYDQNQGADRKQLIRDLLATFETKNGSDLSWDSWNDDAAWATIALIRGYQVTGSSTWLSAATAAWDMAYKRGWDSTYGGGIWENMDAVPSGGKCGLSNWPFVISGALIYEATQDMDYLTKSEQIYAWSRANVFDTKTGRVYEQVGPNGVSGDDNAYNSGLIVNAASSLYKITGTSQYSADAALAAKHVMDKYPIMTEDHPANGDFGGDQFFRGLSQYARQNNLWSTYYPWLENNCTAAWNNRRTDYNVSINNFTMKTPTGNLDAMEAEGSVVVQMVTQIDVTSLADAGAGLLEAGTSDGGGSVGGDASGGSSDASGASGASGMDAGPATRGGAGADDGGGVNGADGGAPVQGAGENGASGCACTTAGSTSSEKRSPGGLALLAIGALFAAARRERRARPAAGRGETPRL
jgi:MYXO-CTERM domain-containing protein